jgi:hypothetical protein
MRFLMQIPDTQFMLMSVKRCRVGLQGVGSGIKLFAEIGND